MRSLTIAMTLFTLAACGGAEAPAPETSAGDDAKVETKTETKAEAADQAEAAKAEAKPAAGDIPAPADVAAPPADATTAESGLAYRQISGPGTGEKPTASDTVEVHYTGWTTDGKMFDSSVKRGRTATFPLNGVIAGWTEGVQYIGVGDTYRLWIPEEMAYKGMPGRPAGMLVFDVELKSIKRAPETPTDVAAPPADATTTKSGLAYKVLQEGEGDEHPTATTRVTVHYTGWTTDGKSFDSSVTRGQPATFGLNQVIAGWTEGLQLMTKGAKYRFWIPEELAYKGMPRKPAGMLVFDVELLSF